METILSLSKSEDERRLDIKISSGEYATVYLWGLTYYTVVSNNILKSSIRPIALDFFRQKDVKKYLNTKISTIFANEI